MLRKKKQLNFEETDSNKSVEVNLVINCYEMHEGIVGSKYRPKLNRLNQPKKKTLKKNVV